MLQSEDPFQKQAGSAFAASRTILRRSFKYYGAPAVSALRSQIDDMIRAFDHIKIVFDHDHGITKLYQLVQNVDQAMNVSNVKSCRRLIEDINGIPRTTLAQFGRQLDALRFTAGERRCRLTEFDISQPDVKKRLDTVPDFRDVLKI